MNGGPTSAFAHQPHGSSLRRFYMLGVVLTAALVVLVTRSLSANSAPAFVHVCGSRFCVADHVFTVRGATAYGKYVSPAAEVALARRANLNVLELSEFDAEFHVLSDVESRATWRRVDRFIAAAAAARLHVILNLSEYGQSLEAARITPTRVDWGGYLRFIADRRNTVTHVLYKNDPTIAMVELFGEITPPHDGSDPGAAGTANQITSFFRRTLAEWRSLAPNILASSGGFSYLGDPASGLDWKGIVRDRNDATCDIEVNSVNDLRVGVGHLSSFCKRLGKPWFLAAWSSCYGDPARGYDYFSSDRAMAEHARAMYRVARGGAPAARQSIGNDFWNLADTPAVSGTCDIGPGFPLTFAAIRAESR